MTIRLGPSIPDTYSTAEIEQHLDRVALEISVSKNAAAILPLYEWLEYELHQRKRATTTMDSVMSRLKRCQDQTAARS